MANTSLHDSPEKGPEFKRIYEMDSQAMLAALRVVLGLPRVLSS